MVAAGLTNREIGEALFISESTAGVHVSHIMAKLGVGSRTEAAAWAYHAGLVGTAPGAMLSDGPPDELALTDAPEPQSGRFGSRRRVVAVGIGGVVVLAAIAVGLTIAALNAGRPAVGGLSSASASPSLSASRSAVASPSVAVTNRESSAPGSPSPTLIPLPSGTWSVTGTMLMNTANQTATLLGDGTVLVAGARRGTSRGHLPLRPEWRILRDDQRPGAGDDGRIARGLPAPSPIPGDLAPGPRSAARGLL
jgi:hypothetical protein